MTGSMFVLPAADPVDVAIEWLVVRPHPDYPDLYLIVPTDDAPFQGVCDVEMPATVYSISGPIHPNLRKILDRHDPPIVPGPGDTVDIPQARRFARCGESGWMPAAALKDDLRTGEAPEEVVKKVRQVLAKLARGQAIPFTDQQGETECDPEYESHMHRIAYARERTQRAAESA